MTGEQYAEYSGLADQETRSISIHFVKSASPELVQVSCVTEGGAVNQRPPNSTTVSGLLRQEETRFLSSLSMKVLDPSTKAA
jgi:hypothetical protein